MQAKSVKSPPPRPKLEDCHIYHSIDLPGETLTGDWDLRPVLHQYTGGVDFAHKSVLDVGTASGQLSFYAESKGADIVLSVDAPEDAVIEPIPWAENDPAASQAQIREHLRRVHNGYWYCWHALKSKADVLYQNIYDLRPADVGRFEVVLAGCILLHLQNPVAAIQALAGVCRQTLVIADIEPTPSEGFTLLPNFFKTGQRDPTDLVSWWNFSPKSIAGLLVVMGFKVAHVQCLTAKTPKTGESCCFFSLVAERR